MKHWAVRGIARSKFLQVFPHLRNCQVPSTNSLTISSYVLPYLDLTALRQGSRLVTCPSFVFDARLSPSDCESMALLGMDAV